MPRSGYEDVVLLTGFPSFLANRLLEHLVKTEPHTLVYAIVRAQAAHEAEEFLLQLEPSERHRIVVLDGDAAALDLGLSGQELRSLTREVDRIHHLAHASYLGLDRRECERLNVGGAGEILEVAAACTSLQCLVFHSTTQVAGDRRGVVREEELESGQSFPTVVAETRARGEKLARRAMRRLPIAVLRPSTIVGDSLTGRVDRLDGPYLFVTLILSSPPDFPIPLPGRGDAPLHMVPVDYVTRASHAIGRDPRAPGRTFHIVDPNPLPARRVFELIAEAAKRPLPRGSFPTNLARALLRTPGLERFAKSPRAFVDQLATDVRFDARNTDAILAGTGIVCPPFESYVAKMVEYVRERRDRASARPQPPSAPPAEAEAEAGAGSEASRVPSDDPMPPTDEGNARP